MRDKLTEGEKDHLLSLARKGLEKLDSDKNRKKEHWGFFPVAELVKMINIECQELVLALYREREDEIETECHDIINECLMILDNLHRKGRTF